MFSSYGDPFARLQQELERMLSSFEGSSPTGVYPPLNVFDGGENVVLKAELPGVDPAKLAVEVRDNAVTISGQRTTDTEQKGAYHRRERVDGEFRRVIRLPARLENAEAKAEYRHGVLTVRIPKAKEVRPRRLQVEAA